MTPMIQYKQDCHRLAFQQDDAQYTAVTALDHLYHQYHDLQSQSVTSRWPQWLPFNKKPAITPPQGLYLWGGVGRGKTYLMDVFCQVQQDKPIMRTHFHRFMYRVHQELQQLNDTCDPLEIVADKLAQEADILCFDEFYVSDITDAMILAGLLKALFARGVILVATSNLEPDALYRNGLQRARFVPAIELIKQHCQVLNIDNGIDYRLRTLEQGKTYYFPLNDQTSQSITQCFAALTDQVGTSEKSIDILNRTIVVEHSTTGVLQASFSQLCQGARSQNDYIEISRLYHTVLLTQVPVILAEMDDAARRFIALVDEFYERKVSLIISADAPLEQLYQGERLAFEFVRCQSRLVEMQSVDYLSQAHLEG